MKITPLKKSLLEKIKSAPEEDVKAICRLYQTMNKAKKEATAWNDLAPHQKKIIPTGLTQLDNGLGLPFAAVLENIKTKHGINR